jgi:hypothetical protein
LTTPATSCRSTSFLPFDSADEAATVGALLRSAAARDLLDTLMFRDAKRPVTKRLLQRLDLRGLAALTGYGWVL